MVASPGWARVDWHETHDGGAGASVHRDGNNQIAVTMGNQMNTPIEALEAAYPVRHEAYGLRDPTAAARVRRLGYVSEGTA